MVADPFTPGGASAVRVVDGPVGQWSALVRQHRRLLFATGVFFGFALYYGVCLYPGVGGVVNPGDSAKYQVLAHAPIMVHGPGYPLYLLLASGIRALDLSLPGWWQISFALSALPGALATAFAFLIAERVTGSVRYGLAAALLLGSAHLMAVQSTEAEVYALNIAFVLAVVYLLLLFVETQRMRFFLAACAVYAMSFGNHLMMVMLVPLFLAMTVMYRRQILQPAPIAIIVGFVVLGASQYLYLAYVAYDPATAYSEYMPLPPPPGDLVRYILGLYFSNLYGSGLDSSRTAEQLLHTLWKAHPWLAVPLMVAGATAFLVRVRRSDFLSWRGVALLYASALCFLPFVLWYGAGDIQSFHLPVLALLLLAATVSLGAAARGQPVAFRALGVALAVAGAVRLAQSGLELADREPGMAEVLPQIREVLAEMPRAERRPFLALGYDARMAAMYHLYAGDLPHGPVYRLSWRVLKGIDQHSQIAGAAVLPDARKYLGKLQRLRPDMSCRLNRLNGSRPYQLEAYGFNCVARAQSSGEAPRRRAQKSSTEPAS